MATALSQKNTMDIVSKEKKSLFKTELNDGIVWLSNAYDDINKGWGYIPEIPVNVQNTAEVIDTFIKCYEMLTNDQLDILNDCVDAWLEDIHTVDKITIDNIWILKTLNNIRNHMQIFKTDYRKKVDNAIVECLGAFFLTQNEDGGWGDTKGDLSQVSRTAHALYVISNIVFEPSDYQKNAIEKAINWLLKMQNNDGGWGNVSKNAITNQYIRRINLSYKQLEFQYQSNAACTGHAMMALKAAKPHAYKIQLNKAAEYLIKTQEADGHWELFNEFSLKKEVKVTFKHFSTTIATEALLYTYSIDYSSEVLINAIDYLISIQDPVYKGWKSSSTSEIYTWSTCNVLSLFMGIKKHFERIKASEFMAIIKEWWGLKQEKEISVFKVGRKTFSFNKTFGLSFCIVFTLLLFTWIAISLVLTNGAIMLGSLDISKVVKALTVIIFTLLIGIPWTVYIKFSFREMEDSWFNTIGWVYG
ncbi:MAG: terpene cyclase/mutase family protein, partial [Clostridia bacterium]|nr:terpene cyclase/mutase family protein [Clostridia bacterium]